MAPRQRNPSSRAIEAADALRARKPLTPPPVPSTPSPPPSPVATVKARSKPSKATASSRKKGKGKAKVAPIQAVVDKVAEEEGEKDDGGNSAESDQDMADRDEADDNEEKKGSEEVEKDLTLYCICLGFDTGEQPMIQCEYCSNWFHFGCINLNDSEAARIEAYCCDICEEMGVGQTIQSEPTTTKNKGKSQVKARSKITKSPTPTKSKSKSKPKTKPSQTKSKSKSKSRPRTSQATPLSDDHFKSDGEPSASTSSAASHSDVGDESDEEEDVSDAEFDNGASRSKTKGRSDSSKRKAVASANVEDDEYAGDEESVLRDASRSKKRARGSQAKVDSSEPPAPANGARAANFKTTAESPPIEGALTKSVPADDKTRTHVRIQLATILKSVFTARSSDNADQPDKISAQAAMFAVKIEAHIFDVFAEVDPKGVRGPRAKYSTKFRSLHFNLKSNAMFRSRIAANELSPEQIVNMTNEDLMTPELRAMAESVRAASLKNSVKEVLAAPTAKRTHKGEEEIDNSAAAAAIAEEKEMDRQATLDRDRRADTKERDRSEATEKFSPAPSPRLDTSFSFGSPRMTSREVHGSPKNLAPSPSPTIASTRPQQPFSASNISIDLGELGLEPEVAQSSPESTRKASTRRHDSTEVAEEDTSMPPPRPRNRSSFDINSVWGKIKESPSLESGEKLEGLNKAGEEDPDAMDMDTPEPEENPAEPSTNVEEEAEIYDPFDAITRKDNEDNEDFEAALLRGEELPLRKPKAKAISTTPPPEEPIKALESKPKVQPLSELLPIWAGNLLVPEHGGFPAFCVQVGGRPFAPTPQTWNRILPRSLAMDGRIPTAKAIAYLVECAFASTRELSIVGILPDLTGPSELTPQKPTSEKCLSKYAYIIDYYVKNDRIGVIAPQDHLKGVVRDIYVIPLRKDEAIPEYIELLDHNQIPETGTRDQDMLLCVLVLVKGVIPTAIPAPPRPVDPFIPKQPVNSSPTWANVPSAYSAPTGLQSVVRPNLPGASPIVPPPRGPAPSSMTQPPLSVDPSLIPSILRNADISGLSDLLANPTLLQTVIGHDPQAAQTLLGNPQLAGVLQQLSGSAKVTPAVSGASQGFIHPSRGAYLQREQRDIEGGEYAKNNRGDPYYDSNRADRGNMERGRGGERPDHRMRVDRERDRDGDRSRDRDRDNRERGKDRDRDNRGGRGGRGRGERGEFSPPADYGRLSGGWGSRGGRGGHN